MADPCRVADVPPLSLASGTASADLEPAADGGTSRSVVLVGFDADSRLPTLLQRQAMGAGISLEIRIDAGIDGGAEAAGDAVWAFGPGIEPPAALRHAEAILAARPAGPRAAPAERLFLVFAAGAAEDRFQALVDDDRVFYLSRQPPADRDVAWLILSAVRRPRPSPRPAAPDLGEADTAALVAALRSLAREDSAASAIQGAARAVCQLLAAASAAGWLYDPATDTLCSRDASGDQRRQGAAAGLASFVVRTGRPVRLTGVSADPRFDPAVDAPGTEPPAHLLAVAVPSPTGRTEGDATPLGVLIALRTADAPAFDAAAEDRLRAIARLLAPILRQLLDEEALADAARGDTIFRRQALDYHRRAHREPGRPLDVDPRWLGRAYQLLLAAVTAALLYALFGSYHEYARGPAAIHSAGRVDVTARLQGSAVAIEVEPGEAVAAGDVLVRFYGAQEAAATERIVEEYESLLLRRLLEPADAGTEGALAALRAEKELVEKRLEERVLRAPRSGRVSDVRIRPGQAVAPGDVVLSLAGDGNELTVVALLPGRYRPQLVPGMPLRLEIDGYPYAYQHTVLTQVSDGILGPAEARRQLPPDIADSLPIDGPVVQVQARLPDLLFASGGVSYRFHDGLTGQVEARVRSQPILFSLLPGLQALKIANAAGGEEAP